MFTYRKEVKMKNSSKLKMFEPLYTELDVENDWIAFYRFVFIFRRLLIAAAIVLVEKLAF